MCLTIEDNFLRNFDLLGGRIGFKFNGKSSHKIPFGGILSIILLTVFSYYAYFIILPFIDRKFPRLVIQNYKDISPPKFYLNSNKIFFGVKITVPGIEDIEKYLKIKAWYELQQNDSVNQTEVKLINIDTTKEKEFVSLYKDLKISSSKKLDLDDYMALEGSHLGSSYSRLKLQVSLHNISNDYYDKVERILSNGGNILVFFSDFSLEAVNYRQPLKNFISYISDEFNVYDSKSSVLEFSLSNIWLDQGYLFDILPDPYEKILHHNTDTNYSVRLDKNLNLYTVLIQLTKLRTNIIRSYMKIPELLSILGGGLIILCFIFYYLSDYVNDKILYLKLIENLFEMDSGVPKIKKVEKKVLRRYPISELTGFTPIKKNKTNNEMLELSSHRDKEDPNKYRKIRQFIQDKPFFSKCDICLFLFFCCFRFQDKRIKKQYLYSKATILIDKFIDIVRVTKKIMQIDLLKYLILNDDQITVSKLIGKPFLTLNNKDTDSKFLNLYFKYSEEIFHSDFDIKKFREKEKIDIQDAYQRILNKTNQSIIDKKIISSCKENLDLIEIE